MKKQINDLPSIIKQVAPKVSDGILLMVNGLENSESRGFGVDMSCWLAPGLGILKGPENGAPICYGCAAYAALWEALPKTRMDFRIDRYSDVYGRATLWGVEPLILKTWEVAYDYLREGYTNRLVDWYKDYDLISEEEAELLYLIHYYWVDDGFTKSPFALPRLSTWNWNMGLEPYKNFAQLLKRSGL